MDCLPSSADSNGKLLPKTRVEGEVDRLGGGGRPVLRPPHLHPLPEHVELPLDVLEGGEGVEVGVEEGEAVEDEERQHEEDGRSHCLGLVANLDAEIQNSCLGCSSEMILWWLLERTCTSSEQLLKCFRQFLRGEGRRKGWPGRLQAET